MSKELIRWDLCWFFLFSYFLKVLGSYPLSSCFLNEDLIFFYSDSFSLEFIFSYEFSSNSTNLKWFFYTFLKFFCSSLNIVCTVSFIFLLRFLSCEKLKLDDVFYWTNFSNTFIDFSRLLIKIRLVLSFCR